MHQPHRFPGQYEDSETAVAMFDPSTYSDPGMDPVVFVYKPALHYNWHRYYDSMVGRYTQPDPIDLASGDANLFRYAQHNPCNRMDVDGLDPGQLFMTPYHAAQDALRYVSFGGRAPVEGGGFIYETYLPNPGFFTGMENVTFYTYDDPVFGHERGIPIKKLLEQYKRLIFNNKKVCGIFHSHIRKLSSEKTSQYFSQPDVNWSRRFNVSGDLTNTYKYWRFDLGAMKAREFSALPGGMVKLSGYRNPIMLDTGTGPQTFY